MNDHRGSSFLGLLRAEFPDLAPSWGAQPADLSLVHGTTICAIEYEGGALLAADRRATMGNVVMNDEVTKVFRVDDYSAIAIAGTFGPSVKMAKLFQVELEHYEKIEGVPLTLEGKATKLSLMIEQNFPAAIQGLMVMPLYVGYDPDMKHADLFEYDITGGVFSKTEEEPFSCSGSGGDRARSTFEHFWRRGLSRDEAVDLVLRALRFAAKRDTATGKKGHIVMSISADGVEVVRDGSEE